MNVVRLCVASLAMLLPAMAFAHQGSVEDQIACTPDVYRLCASLIPDEDAIAACLEKNKPALSSACRKVFSKPEKGSSGESDDE